MPRPRIAPARDGGREPGSFACDRRGWPKPPGLGDGRCDAIARRLYMLMRTGNRRRFHRIFLDLLGRRPLNDLPVHGPLPRGPLCSMRVRRLSGLIRYAFALRWEDRLRAESEGFRMVIEPVLAPGYLGNPEVVHNLLRDYLLLCAQAANEELPWERVVEETQRLAAVFAGEDPSHPPVDRWNAGQTYRDGLIAAMNLDAALHAAHDTVFVAAEALRTLAEAARTRVTAWRSQGGALNLDDVHRSAMPAFLGTPAASGWSFPAPSGSD